MKAIVLESFYSFTAGDIVDVTGTYSRGGFDYARVKNSTAWFANRFGIDPLVK